MLFYDVYDGVEGFSSCREHTLRMTVRVIQVQHVYITNISQRRLFNHWAVETKVSRVDNLPKITLEEIKKQFQISILLNKGQFCFSPAFIYISLDL